jgi:UDP-2-acetamido-2,6-beta-L-arabino-hexul-4-ose reductase
VDELGCDEIIFLNNHYKKIGVIKIGITGQSGFIGTYLFNYLGLQNEVERIPFDKSYFRNQSEICQFVKQCDVIIHLAAINRHPDPEVIYNTNMDLVRLLVEAMESTGSKPHIIFSSSTQEERDNLYGKSKKDGRDFLIKWAIKNEAIFTGLVIPNVYGPFSSPYYNSVIATFSHQLINNEEPVIQKNDPLKLIYVGELVELIWEIILKKQNTHNLLVPFTSEFYVSEILNLLQNYKSLYIEMNTFPSLKKNYELNLFNTFRSFINHEKYFPVHLKKNSDERGIFVETIKGQTGGQFSYSITHKGITRGNHFHTRKVERFAVIKGKASIELRKIGTDKVIRFDLDGNSPAFVDMPVWYTHNITNTGGEDLLTVFWINEFYNPEDPDTYYEMV